ncbi:DNA polymerase III subunit epsilon [Jatrophihabitans sp. DSM 45814]
MNESGGYAIVDLETTGILTGYHHRVVEVAVVQLDEQGRVTGEFSTLLNPGRDLGPQHIHGIRAADVLDASQFGDVASHVSDLLRGRVLVAHNLRFELMHLSAEFGRLEVQFPVTYETRGVHDGLGSTAATRRRTLTI